MPGLPCCRLDAHPAFPVRKHRRRVVLESVNPTVEERMYIGGGVVLLIVIILLIYLLA
jgi:hypothetical protein